MMSLLQKLHDSPLIGFVAGLIYGSLSAAGFMIPGHQSEVEQAVQAVVGGIIGIVTVISYFDHKSTIEKAKILNQNTPSAPQVNGTVLSTP